jgi:predicted glutamine amidotransferase
MMAHVRYATSGGVCLENVHPFTRELWGIVWSFAHNGQVPKFDDSTKQEDQPVLGKTRRWLDVHYHPVGDTDSEAVFCAILNALKAEFDTLPTLPVLHAFLQRICAEIIQGEESSTIFNFLLGCGQYTLFAYSWPGQRPGSQVWNGLWYIIRQPPFSTAQLVDVAYSVDFAQVTTPSDRVAVITTKPLTDECGWREFQRGELIMFDKGLPYQTSSCCESVERDGRGLYSKHFRKNNNKNCPILLSSSQSSEEEERNESTTTPCAAAAVAAMTITTTTSPCPTLVSGLNESRTDIPCRPLDIVGLTRC